VQRKQQLEIWGRTQREATRAASQTAETILGGANSAGSNASWQIEVESCLKSRQNSTWVAQHERL